MNRPFVNWVDEDGIRKQQQQQHPNVATNDSCNAMAKTINTRLPVSNPIM
jgi:hypothetical protein